MFKASHSTLIFISGLVWLVIGCILMPLGLNFIVESLLKENSSAPHPVLNFLGSITGGLDQAALILIACSIAIGFFKGRFVFAKSVNRSVNRILSLPNPCSVFKIYSSAYLLLIAVMVLLGVLVKFLPMDIRGAVDVIVGSALINGATLFFRQAWKIKQKKLEV